MEEFELFQNFIYSARMICPLSWIVDLIPGCHSDYRTLYLRSVLAASPIIIIFLT